MAEYERRRAEKEVAKAKKSGTIEKLPKSLENFQEYEENWRKTHYQGYTESQKEYIRRQYQEVFDNGEYHMAIKPADLEKAVQSGRFKNQIETGSSGGVLSFEARKKVTKNLFGADVDHMLPRDFEKYGYLGHRDFVRDAKEASATSDYGSVIIRFNKRALANRVTYTHSDSYGGSLAGTHIAGHDGNNVTISGIEDLPRVQKEVLNTLMFASNETLHNPNGLAHALGGAYFELQYHGDLLITDVESVCFTDYIPGDVVTALKELGIKVYKLTGGQILDEL